MSEQQRVIAAMAHIYVFSTGEAGIQFENLSTKQFVQVLLKVAYQFTQEQERQGNRIFPRLKWWAWKKIMGGMLK